MIKFAREHKKSQLKYYQTLLYTIKNLLSRKDILKTLQSSGFNNYIQNCKNCVLEKQPGRNLPKWNKVK